MRRNLFWLSDEQWKRIEPRLPTDVWGVEWVDDRRVISGIVHLLKIGCHWRDCPPQASSLSVAASSLDLCRVSDGSALMLAKLMSPLFGHG